jgi:hypothetical protein
MATSYLDENGEYIVSMRTLTPDEITELEERGCKLVPERQEHWYDWNSQTEDWDYNETVHVDYMTEYVRANRDVKLRKLDRKIASPLRYSAFSQELKDEIGVYRQALLDVPQQQGFPLEVVWPEEPVFP